MGIITAKSKSKDDHWGMGLLLVFFPEDHHPTTAPAPTTSTILDSSSLTTTEVAIKRTKILTTAQSTISICVLLLFLTLLLFTLSTFEPFLPPNTTPSTTPCRFLSDTRPPPLPNKPNLLPWFITTSSYLHTTPTKLAFSFALQGMGKIYMGGTRAMPDLLVCHVSQNTLDDDFKLFLRVLHRSGLTSRADVVFLFPSFSMSKKFEPFIGEENDSFLKLLNYYHTEKKSNATGQGASTGLGFDVTRFLRSGNKEAGEPLWGKRARVIDGYNEIGTSNETRLSYGSVVSFEASELDPEDSLAGFLDHVPMSLRRWACYPMLLGRVRRNFKHVMLVDVKSLFLLGDPLNRVRNLSSDSVYVIRNTQQSNRPSKRNSDKTQPYNQINPAVLMGGARGIRRLSTSMLHEIVRVEVQRHKKRNSVTESGVLGRLVGNDHILKNVDLVESTESLPDSSSLSGSGLAPGDYNNHYSVFQRGNGNRKLINSIIMKRICACEMDSSVYRDC